MEYNEPLNLSVKKKPIAVVIPSSSTTNNKVDGTGSAGSIISNDADDPNERLDTLSSPSGGGGINDNDNLTNRSTPVTHLDETNTCHNATTDLVSVCSSTNSTLLVYSTLYIHTVCGCSVYILRLTKRMFFTCKRRPNNCENISPYEQWHCFGLFGM